MNAFLRFSASMFISLVIAQQPAAAELTDCSRFSWEMTGRFDDSFVLGSSGTSARMQVLHAHHLIAGSGRDLSFRASTMRTSMAGCASDLESAAVKRPRATSVARKSRYL
jgi:hypothetical protein